MVLLLFSFVLAVIYLIAFSTKGASTPKTVIKTLSIAILVLIAFIKAGPVFLLFGLGFCSVGDFFLARDSQKSFLYGLGAFAFGHIFYILLFLQLASGIDPTLPLIFTVLLGVFGALMATFLWSKAGALRVPVMVYIFIIVLMGLAALRLPMGVETCWVILGAALFILSDSILAFQLFVLKLENRFQPLTSYGVWITYWLAQASILMGVLSM